ncbi:MAG: ATP-binding cassette domain-containing protein, partial [Allosphingosinicella sp.]
MLSIDKLTYRIGQRILFDQADASIAPGHRVGLVGRNGTGKTTLLRLIAGEIDPDGGAIRKPARWSVGMTRQEAPAGPDSLIDTVLAADPELAGLAAEAETAHDPHRIAEIHERLRDKDAHSAPARAARILAGLGFP